MYGNFSLYPYAKAGATCSNKLVDRPYGAVTEYQLPLYLTEKDNGSLELDPDVTVYTLWIGTNDNGAGGILTGDQTPGVTLVDTIACAVNWVKTLYTSGASNFVFQNVRLVSMWQSKVHRWMTGLARCCLCSRRSCTLPTRTRMVIGLHSVTRQSGTCS